MAFYKQNTFQRSNIGIDFNIYYGFSFDTSYDFCQKYCYGGEVPIFSRAAAI